MTRARTKGRVRRLASKEEELHQKLSPPPPVPSFARAGFPGGSRIGRYGGRRRRNACRGVQDPHAGAVPLAAGSAGDGEAQVQERAPDSRGCGAGGGGRGAVQGASSDSA